MLDTKIIYQRLLIQNRNLLFEELLKDVDINYEKQKRLISASVDFFIPERIAILIDGAYWHNYPHRTARDFTVDKMLREKHYNVLRFWDWEVYKFPKECIDAVRICIRGNSIVDRALERIRVQ